MTPETGDGGLAASLRGYLAARMRPLIVLLIVVVSIAAPFADYLLTLRALRLEAAATAHEVAVVIDREVQERPVLWRYGSLKLLSHVRTYAMRSSIAHIEIVDRDGARIEFGGRDAAVVPPVKGLLWESAPLVIGGEVVGHVWAAARPQGAVREALLLLIPFGLLGFGLAALVYWLPLRAMGNAERRIVSLIGRLRESQAALASFNQTLEQQVAARSAELREALAELQKKEVRLREVSSRAIALQEAERRVIARELHDSAGQALTAIRINLQLMGQGAGDGALVQQLSAKTLEMADSTLEEIRRAVVMLGPAILDDFGLAVAVRRYCDDFQERTGVAMTCDVEVPEGLSPALESACYRLVQESLTNVARHAGAAYVSVHLYGEEDAEGERLVLEIEDDGCGFNPETAGGDRPVGKGGRGLVGMRERVELLSGTIEFDSRPGEGTHIRIEFPR